MKSAVRCGIWAWVVFAAVSAVAAPPSLIPYVAEIRTSSGAPFSPPGGTANIQAALYVAPQGGAPAWGPVDYVGTPVDGGVFSIVLDGTQVPAQLGGVPVSLADLLAGPNDIWLALSINGQPMTPRQRMLSVPYAVVAADALAVGGLLADELATVSDLEDHTHGAADVVSGVFAPARIPPGTDSTKLPLAGGVMAGGIDLSLFPPGGFRFVPADAPPVTCSPATVGYAYFDTQMVALRICDGQEFLDLQAMPAQGPILVGSPPSQIVNQTQLPGECIAVSFRNEGGQAVSGFGAPQVSGDYAADGCAPSTCTGTLAPAQTCTVSVRGTAQTNGALAGSVAVHATQGGTGTVALSGAATGLVPDPFAFVDVDNQPLSTVVLSNVVAVTGLSTYIPVTVAGGDLRVDGGAWSSEGLITSGSTLQLRTQTAATPGTAVVATVTAGAVVALWQVSTAAPLPCGLPWGGSLGHGQSVTAYATASATCAAGSCPSQTRTCSNGTLSGSYTNASCTAATGCSITGLRVSAGYYGTTGSSATVTISFNKSYSSVQTVKACESGCTCSGSGTTFTFGANGTCLGAGITQRIFTFAQLPTSASVSLSGTGVHDYKPSYALVYSDGSIGASVGACSPTDFQYTSWNFTQSCTFTYP